jgi:hypothetical protein
MKTLKFINNDTLQRNFYGTLRNRVNDYFTTKGISQKGDASQLVKAAVMLSIYIAPFIFLLTTPVSSWLA